MDGHGDANDRQTKASPRVQPSRVSHTSTPSRLALTAGRGRRRIRTTVCRCTGGDFSRATPWGGLPGSGSRPSRCGADSRAGLSDASSSLPENPRGHEATPSVAWLGSGGPPSRLATTHHDTTPSPTATLLGLVDLSMHRPRRARATTNILSPGIHTQV